MEKMTIEQAIKENGFYIATIHGDSMMPFLRNERDTVRLVPVKGVLKKYDLPLFKRPTGQYVLHRIVKVKKDHYIICGDNRFLRERIPFDQIVGVAEAIYKDEKEILVTDKDYVNQVKHIVNTFWIRRIKSKILKNRHCCL